MPFEMPGQNELAKMSPEEIENKRIEAEKESTRLAGEILTLRTERNELERRRLEISDKINKASQMRRELTIAADELKSRFWAKRNGY